MPDKFSHHTHTHTFTRNTPAKVTQAPASKFTHCSQGHTCVCACVCVCVCVCVSDMSSIFHLHFNPPYPLLTNHDASLILSAFSLSLRACSVLRGLHPSSCFILSSFFRHRPPRSCPPHSFLRPLLSLSHSLCSRLAVIN